MSQFTLNEVLMELIYLPPMLHLNKLTATFCSPKQFFSSRSIHDLFYLTYFTWAGIKSVEEPYMIIEYRSDVIAF